MSWPDELQDASWNGTPFFVEAAQHTVGRNTGDHLYPLREKDPIWIEDVGLAPSVHRIVGFLLGDDIADQQDSMVNAMQAEGQGELVHPTLGSLTGSIVGGCQFLLRKDRGRYIEMSFTFIENQGDAPFPASEDSTQDAVTGAADEARTSSLSDLGGSLKSGLQQAKQAVHEVQAVGQQALSIGRSAASLIGVAGVVPGNFGRFVGGGGAIGAAFQGVSTIGSALSTASRLGARVNSTVSNLQRLAGRL